MICCKRPASPRVWQGSTMVVCREMDLASAAVWTTSIADSIAAAKSTEARSNLSLPRRMRATSSRSSMSWVLQFDVAFDGF